MLKLSSKRRPVLPSLIMAEKWENRQCAQAAGRRQTLTDRVLYVEVTRFFHLRRSWCYWGAQHCTPRSRVGSTLELHRHGVCSLWWKGKNEEVIFSVQGWRWLIVLPYAEPMGRKSCLDLESGARWFWQVGAKPRRIKYSGKSSALFQWNAHTAHFCFVEWWPGKWLIYLYRGIHPPLHVTSSYVVPVPESFFFNYFGVAVVPIFVHKFSGCSMRSKLVIAVWPPVRSRAASRQTIAIFRSTGAWQPPGRVGFVTPTRFLCLTTGFHASFALLAWSWARHFYHQKHLKHPKTPTLGSIMIHHHHSTPRFGLLNRPTQIESLSASLHCS